MKRLLAYLYLALGLGLVVNVNAKSEEFLKQTAIFERVKELGIFEKPTKYPEGMKKILDKGCNGFSCKAKKATQKMSLIFNRRPIYYQRHPGAQLYGMAMFELFYQQRLKEEQKKIEKFMNSWPDKKKHEHSIISLMKLNEARKKMRSTLGMDLNIGAEEAMENFWLMGDFLELGEIKKQKVSKAITKRGKLLAKYKKAINTFNSEIKKNKDEEFYEKIAKKGWTFGRDDLDDKFKDFVKDTNKIRKKFSSLPADNLHITKNIDKAFKEIETTTKFITQSFNKGDIEIASMILSFADKSTSDISKLVPLSYYNDMSNVDISKLGKNAFKKIKKITGNIKKKKSETLPLFVQNMTKIHRKGFNSFRISKNLKDLGVDTLSFESISKAIKVDTPIETGLNNEQVNLLDKTINFTKIYMEKLGYSSSEIKKEVDAIKLIKIDNIKKQEILIARRMIIGGASDKEIQKEINDWNAINKNNLKKEAYLAALNMKATGISSKEIQKKVEMINAIETMREVDELLVEIEHKIVKKYNTENFSTETDNGETLVFAQASKDKFLDDDFESKKNELFFNQFFPEKIDKQVKSFSESTAEKYSRISTPLTIISVIISPNPYNVYQLTKKLKEHADVKKAKILAMSTYGTAEDDLGGGDYVDPRIFARTAQVLTDLQKKNIESQYLAKKFNYSITLISAEVEKFDEPKRSDDENKDKGICVEEKCYKSPETRTLSKPKNPLKPIDNVFKKASLTGRADLVEKIELMINNKNITVHSVAEFTTLIDNLIEIQIEAERLGIAEATAKVSATFESLGIMKDTMPTLEAMQDAGFDAEAHVAAMEVLVSEAGLHADIAEAMNAASKVQDMINQLGSEEISAELAEQNAQVQQALNDAQQALDDSRRDTGLGVHDRFPGGKWDGTGPVPDCHGEGTC